MNRDGHKDTAFFVGPEVEHTPAYSRRTLFVVGKQDVQEIVRLAQENRVTHVFLGANHSFSAVGPADTYWNTIVTALLEKGYMVTLDYEAHTHSTVLNMLDKAVWQSRSFVPLLSVRIANVQTSSQNLTIKIDDIDFKATNPGVWCLHHHEVTDSNRFTDWVEYSTDEIVGTVAPVEKETPVLNQQEIGLDLTSTSGLKPELEDVSIATAVTTAVDAADAYAAGATSDPLGKVPSNKKVKAKV